jgi:hypothetical protein
MFLCKVNICNFLTGFCVEKTKLIPVDDLQFTSCLDCNDADDVFNKSQLKYFFLDLFDI